MLSVPQASSIARQLAVRIPSLEYILFVKGGNEYEPLCMTCFQVVSRLQEDDPGLERIPQWKGEMITQQNFLTR